MRWQDNGAALARGRVSSDAGELDYMKHREQADYFFDVCSLFVVSLFLLNCLCFLLFVCSVFVCLGSGLAGMICIKVINIMMYKKTSESSFRGWENLSALV